MQGDILPVKQARAAKERNTDKKRIKNLEADIKRLEKLLLKVIDVAGLPRNIIILED